MYLLLLSNRPDDLKTMRQLFVGLKIFGAGVIQDSSQERLELSKSVSFLFVCKKM
jgi:hypothetical protein